MKRRKQSEIPKKKREKNELDLPVRRVKKTHAHGKAGEKTPLEKQIVN